ncbi:MAG: phospholipase D family protein [Proteobacteria bacterium]|nr:phospholipase D family protein [Pseudomonadota bacterium]
MFRYVTLLIITILMTACASLPKDIPKVPSYAVEIRDETRIGKTIALKAEKHPGESGFYILPSDIDAFIARAVLIEAAERTLDLQYYIVNDNLTVSVLMEKLIRAADRGVRVRLLFDDLGTGLNDSQLWLLNNHPNIEIRLFNPVPDRRKGFPRLFALVGNFKLLNHRMHNKAFVVDNTIGIVGGRNLADEYFGAREDENFTDMDIMAAGPIVKDISKSFDIYWNSEWAIPFEFFDSRQPADEDYKKAFEILKEKNNKARDSKYAVSLRESDFLNRLVAGNISSSWAKGFVVYDLPEKISDDDHTNSAVYLGTQLFSLIKDVKSEVILISPYFVPGKTGVEFYGKLQESGIQVRIGTNSLASTDVVSVHSGYARYRKSLLEKGVEIYEMKPETGEKEKEGRRRFIGSSRGSLHAKVYIFDGKSVFVGSRNLDARSKQINTEIGIYVESPEIAEQARKFFEAGASLRYSYKVTLSDNSSLIWKTEEDGKEVEYTHDPMTSIWRRLSVQFMSIFVPESLL